MKLSAGSILGWMSLAAVVTFVLLDTEDGGGPGPLSPPHAGLDALEGAAGCEACHGAGTVTLAAACGECHEDVLASIAETRGLHGGLEEGVAQDCGACHGEHHGDQLPLVDERTFLLATGMPQEDYDHAGLAFGLVGAHVPLECSACHEQDSVRFAEGPRFLGLSQTCTDCHEDAHEGLLGKDCASCHGQEQPFLQAAAFEHTTSFPLEGTHAGLACTACHEPESETSWLQEAAASQRGAPPSARSCSECHESPHGDRLTSAAPDCADCHGVDAPSAAFVPHANLDLRPDHGRFGMALTGAHHQVACADCHDGATYEQRYPGREAQDCRACHEDPHAGQFLTSTSCQECHTTEAFTPSTFDLERHGLTAFALDGAHASAACAACHEPDPTTAVTRFVGLATACEGCHADPHRGLFASELGGTGCAECHTTADFLRQLTFDHTRTGHPLRGAHSELSCEACHGPRTDEGQLGPVAQLFGEDTSTCAACHSDPHGGAFVEPDGEPTGCNECHTEEAFRPTRAFDHGSTGFPLEGLHAAADCAACHGQSGVLESGRSLGRVQEHFPGDASECATCHTDPHGGAFQGRELADAFLGRSDCRSCHDTSGFRPSIVQLDHGRDTGFALEGAHSSLECSACHAPLPERDLLGRSHGYALGTGCADCHEDPHAGQFTSSWSQGRCAACHTTSAFGPAVIDHQTQTRFPLDAQHEGLACAACHVPWPLKNGQEVVRYRPLGRECGDCHAPGTGGGR